MHSVLQGFPPDTTPAFGGRGAPFCYTVSESQQNPTETERKLVCQACFSREKSFLDVVHIMKY